jgi:putative peptidoglycan lipid II flippase
MLDTFFIAYLIPGLIQGIFIESFKNVFIPNYIAEVKTGNDIGPFQTTGFLITGLISIFFILIAILLTDTYLEFFFAGHDEEYYKLIKTQFYYVIPCIVFWGFSSLLTGLLNINSEFRLSTLQGIFMPAAITICILIFKDFLGELTLAIGSLVGSISAFIYLLIVCSRKRIIKLTIRFAINENAMIMLKQVPIKMTGSIFNGLHKVVDQYFAAQLVVGSIAAVNYAQKLPAFAIGIVAIALTNVLLPHFSEQVISNRQKAFDDLFRLIKLVFFICLLISAIGILTSEFFIALFFERKEFTGSDTILVASLQQILFIYLPFKICGEILVSFLTSINKNIYMAIVSFISIVLNVVLNFLLINKFGVFGIAIATTTVIIIRNTILFLFARKQKMIHQNLSV